MNKASWSSQAGIQDISGLHVIIFSMFYRRLTVVSLNRRLFSTKKPKSDSLSRLDVPEAVAMLKAMTNSVFTQSVELDIKLNLDSRKPNQMVRSVTGLPHGTGQKLTIAVFARGDKAKEARAAGADIVGEQDLADKILAGNIEFTKCIATPDMMPIVAKVARILGPRGLMPNPKLGTVTMNLTEIIASSKKGTVEFRTDKFGAIKCPVGKTTFSDTELTENIHALVNAIIANRPTGAKGTYFVKSYLTSSQTVAIELNTQLPPFKIARKIVGSSESTVSPPLKVPVKFS